MDYQFKAMLDFITPLGVIEHYAWRREYQGRGAQHWHLMIWVKDAPILEESTAVEVAEFIARYVTCKVPDRVTFSTLYFRVTNYQTHRHNSYCLRKKKTEEMELDVRRRKRRIFRHAERRFGIITGTMFYHDVLSGQCCQRWSRKRSGIKHRLNVERNVGRPERPGTQVWLRNRFLSNKAAGISASLLPKWKGPFRITRNIGQKHKAKLSSKMGLLQPVSLFPEIPAASAPAPIPVFAPAPIPASAPGPILASAPTTVSAPAPAPPLAAPQAPSVATPTSAGDQPSQPEFLFPHPPVKSWPSP
ncbi:hypothetical protein M8J76_007620 [Diaphorina citri]|nr:hypothetical protein M8J76_007620 [Diaphorina citri]